MASGGSILRQDPSADTGSEPLPSLAFCDIHKDQEIERYCDTHECLVCAKCIIYKHKQCCHVTLKDKIGTSNPHTSVIDDMKAVKALLQKVNFLLALKESDRNALTASVKKCRDDVKRLRERINNQLDDVGYMLDACLKSQEFRLHSDIDTHVTDCKHVIEDLEAQLKQLDTCQILDKTTMYIGHSKAEDVIEETRQVVRKLETDLEQNRLLKYEPSEHIKSCLKELHTLGEIVEQRVNSRSKCVSVDKCIDIGTKSRDIRGCTFLPDGTLVSCDDIMRLLHFTDTFKYRSILKLHSHPCDVTAISDQEVVVTLPYKQQLQFVTTSGDLKLDRTVTLDRYCYGIEQCNGQLYVTCHDKPFCGGRGEVVVLDMSGQVLTRIGRIERVLLGTKFMFEKPDYVCVSTDESRIYVSDLRADTVTCLSEEGQIIYQSKEVAIPWGMCVGPRDQQAVCCRSSDNVVLLGDRGQVLCELVTKTEGVKYPQCVTYRPRDGVLVVGMWERGLKVFWLKGEICR